jgi:hypothetical protein
MFGGKNKYKYYWTIKHKNCIKAFGTSHNRSVYVSPPVGGRATAGTLDEVPEKFMEIL